MIVYSVLTLKWSIIVLIYDYTRLGVCAVTQPRSLISTCFPHTAFFGLLANAAFHCPHLHRSSGENKCPWRVRPRPSCLRVHLDIALRVCRFQAPELCTSFTKDEAEMRGGNFDSSRDCLWLAVVTSGVFSGRIAVPSRSTASYGDALGCPSTHHPSAPPGHMRTRSCSISLLPIVSCACAVFLTTITIH